MHQNTLGADFPENTFDVKDLEVVVDTRLNMSQHCALVSKLANGILACIRQNIASRCQPAVEATPGVLYPALGFVIPETLAYWRETNEGAQR